MTEQAWQYVLQQGPLVVLLTVNLYAFLSGRVVTRREFDDSEERTEWWQKRCERYEALLQEAVEAAKAAVERRP